MSAPRPFARALALLALAVLSACSAIRDDPGVADTADVQGDVAPDVIAPDEIRVTAFDADGVAAPTLTASLLVERMDTDGGERVDISFTAAATEARNASLLIEFATSRRVLSATIANRFDNQGRQVVMTSAGRGRYAVSVHSRLSTSALSLTGELVTLIIEDVPDAAKTLSPRQTEGLVSVSEDNQVGTTTFASLRLAGDANGNGRVGFGDVHAIVNQIDSDEAPLAVDANGDGDVTLADIDVVVAHFGLEVAEIRAFVAPDQGGLAVIDADRPDAVVNTFDDFVAPGPDGYLRGPVPVDLAATGVVAYLGVARFGPDQQVDDRLSDLVAIAQAAPTVIDGDLSGNIVVPRGQISTIAVDGLQVDGDLTVLGTLLKADGTSLTLRVTDDLEVAPGGAIRVVFPHVGAADDPPATGLDVRVIVDGTLATSVGSEIATNGNLVLADGPEWIPVDADGRVAAAGIGLALRSEAVAIDAAAQPAPAGPTLPGDAGAPVVDAIRPIAGLDGESAQFVARFDPAGPQPDSVTWDFGGGASPATSSDMSPSVTLAGTGAFTGTLTTTANGVTATVQFIFLSFASSDPRRALDWNLCGDINLLPDGAGPRDAAVWIFTRAQQAGCFGAAIGGGGGGGGGGPMQVHWRRARMMAPPALKSGGCGRVHGRDGRNAPNLFAWVAGNWVLGANIVFNVDLDSGGDGQSVIADCRVPGADAEALAGDGGLPGGLAIKAGFNLGIPARIDIRGSVDVQPGDGGDGGDANAYTATGDDGCPGQAAGEALAVGGNGASALYGAFAGGGTVGGPPGVAAAGVRGIVLWSLGGQLGLSNLSVGPDPRGGDAGFGFSLSGDGGDGTQCGCPGGAGGDALAGGGFGGDAAFALVGGPAQAVVDNASPQAGDGGDADATAGRGGRGGSCGPQPPMNGGAGGAGGDALPDAGAAGRSLTPNGMGGTDGAPGAIVLEPGDGGAGGTGCLPGRGGPAGLGRATLDGAPVRAVLGVKGPAGGNNCAGQPPPLGCAFAADCDDLNDCTEEACVAGQCQYVSAAAGQLCGAGREPCAINRCNASAACVRFADPDFTACDADGDLCSGPDQCVDGACKGTLFGVSCPAPDAACKRAMCNPASGMCGTADAVDGTPCDDGDPCTLGDACASGACAGDPVGAGCDPVCCKVPGLLSASYATIDASACPQAQRQADATLCDDACCKGAGAGLQLHATTNTGTCVDNGHVIVAADQCETVCCDDLLVSGFAPRGDCAAPLPLDQCAEICCESDGVYRVTLRPQCSALFGESVVPDQRCAEVCCAFADSGRTRAGITRGQCEAAGGSVQSDAACAEVCCPDDEAFRVTTADDCAGTPEDLAQCDETCCETLIDGGKTYGTSTVGACAATGGAVDAALCGPVCCDVDGQRGLLPRGDCDDLSGTSLDAAMCQETCCQEGLLTYLERGACSGGATEVALSQCGDVCCAVDGVHLRTRRGLCDAFGTESAAELCDAYVCCPLGAGQEAITLGADCETTGLPPLDISALSCVADASCADDDVCTVDTCTGCGTCRNTPRACDDGLECTQDSCQAGVGEAATGCVFAPVDVGTGCGDDGICDGQGACVARLTLTAPDCFLELAPGGSVDVATLVTGGLGDLAVSLTTMPPSAAGIFTLTGSTVAVAATHPDGTPGTIGVGVRITRGAEVIDVVVVATFADGGGNAFSAQLSSYDPANEAIGAALSGPTVLDAGDVIADFFIVAPGAAWVCTMGDGGTSCAWCWAMQVFTSAFIQRFVVGSVCNPSCNADEACILVSGGPTCIGTNAAMAAQCAATDDGNVYFTEGPLANQCGWLSAHVGAADSTGPDTPEPGDANPAVTGVPLSLGPTPQVTTCGLLALRIRYTASAPLMCNERLQSGDGVSTFNASFIFRSTSP